MVVVVVGGGGGGCGGGGPALQTDPRPGGGLLFQEYRSYSWRAVVGNTTWSVRQKISEPGPEALEEIRRLSVRKPVEGEESQNPFGRRI